MPRLLLVRPIWDIADDSPFVLGWNLTLAARIRLLRRLRRAVAWMLFVLLFAGIGALAAGSIVYLLEPDWTPHQPLRHRCRSSSPA